MSAIFSRRQILKLGALSALSSAGLLACSRESGLDRQLHFANLQEALVEFARLNGADRLSEQALWSWPKTLVHCAQSIEFSMIGYPQQKSALFQQTLGQAAFNLFSWRGRMQHDLAEAIPGAPDIETMPDIKQAQDRLRSAIEQFSSYRGELQPHFAFGALSFEEYEQAHAMHLANHFSGFEIIG
ncbi:DUF1569 domain-containing protein [Aliiglaciecola sp. CAU 1673]|uniref:DUF1569 domain-containing protein n=1 Tax=Aliiglaciecola sp. CAU 1673 TaxID=3032595 RepID=UPI0023DA52A6|nr:DUF1569 domain-containing protein [Aliiglaciecola sp. CAU 1673]MDF2178265.1 DUF1569 domain-containing protein [Aliiglaciecola sp. CAU 1673]